MTPEQGSTNFLRSERAFSCLYIISTTPPKPQNPHSPAPVGGQPYTDLESAPAASPAGVHPKAKYMLRPGQP